jgi:hypothetical protein
LVTRFVQRFNNSRRRLFHAETSGVFLSRFLFAPLRRVKKILRNFVDFSKIYLPPWRPVIILLKAVAFLA